jgi:hypothetical protein
MTPEDIWKIATADKGKFKKYITWDDVRSLDWEEYDTPDELRKIPGVYFLCFAGSNGKWSFDYVGLSLDIGKRLKSNHHIYDPNIHKRILAVEIEEDKYRKCLEWVIINNFQPPKNTAKGTPIGVMGTRGKVLKFRKLAHDNARAQPETA